ncbi:MAG: hypothetical protein CM1200mP28_15190 [Deltaproteobacteria bacterium]|nr:MAG: hypothetical protein CM1200mP28_15190 [Deltaproteobacteria bacterium]
MSLITPTSKKFILTFCLLCLATEVWAVRAKIRFLFPVSMESVTDGFENTTINTSEFVLSFVMPVSRNTQLDFGYSYFNARIEDANTSSEAYSGVFRAHLLEIGAGYTGIELTKTISILFEASTRFPVSGRAGSKWNPGSSEAESISGMGYFLGSGIAYGNIDLLLFYQQRDLTFDELTVLRDGVSKDVALHSTEYGIGIGYTF